MCAKLLGIVLFIIFTTTSWSKAILDSDVKMAFKTHYINTQESPTQSITTIIFLRSLKEKEQLANELSQLPNTKILQMTNIPALLVAIPADNNILDKIVNNRLVAQISLFNIGHEELDNSEQAILLKPSKEYPTVNNWWSNGYTGKNSVLGLIDSGVAIEHPGLTNKTIITRKEENSGYFDFKNGIRSAHGTGVACIYMGEQNSAFPNDVGIAFDAPTIVAGLAGDGPGNFEDLSLTLSSLDWMLNRSGVIPTVINYSVGNGNVTCPQCTDWSGLARIMDYVINNNKILWVKSAGNKGFIPQSIAAPFTSTMSVPADNYNGLTVANMNPAIFTNGAWTLSPDRQKHTIMHKSSRGPTLNGRKKPDITAPGNDTRTCAIDPQIYDYIKYKPTMDYHDGYRLMGGTSSATPHVGGSIMLLQQAGISEPMAQKALLINSADAWTDNGKAGPGDPSIIYAGEHYPIDGSEWNPTYGWGYLNMQKAYEQRNNLVIDKLTLKNKQKSYKVYLPVGAKITLVHERRVGYTSSNKPWALSSLSLKILDAKTQKVISSDDSPKDTVHQVSNCNRAYPHAQCSSQTQPINAIVTVTLSSSTIDGSDEEPFALVMSEPFELQTNQTTS